MRVHVPSMAERPVIANAQKILGNIRLIVSRTALKVTPMRMLVSDMKILVIHGTSKQIRLIVQKTAPHAEYSQEKKPDV